MPGVQQGEGEELCKLMARGEEDLPLAPVVHLGAAAEGAAIFNRAGAGEKYCLLHCQPTRPST